MRSLLAVLALFVVAAPVLAADANENIYNSPGAEFIPPVAGPTFNWDRDVLFFNGPLVNQPGGGFGGADASVLQDATNGDNVYGFGAQISAGNIVADDFSIPAGETWNITSVIFFMYQTNSPTNPSTFTTQYFRVTDGAPNTNPNVVFGDLATNRLSSSVFSNVYRSIESNWLATNRPIMANTCNVAFSLGAGQYWVAWQAAGTLTSGPWQPPVVIWNVAPTGDGWQFTPAGGWQRVVDSGNQAPKGHVFRIEGTVEGPVSSENASWGNIKALYR